jgi:hypothetical protein
MNSRSRTVTGVERESHRVTFEMAGGAPIEFSKSNEDPAD